MDKEVSPEVEMLARMWIECDPNRGPIEKGDGFHPDDPIGQSCTGGGDDEAVCVDTPLTGKPRWHWFIPRAEASLKHFEKHGYKLSKGPKP